MLDFPFKNAVMYFDDTMSPDLQLYVANFGHELRKSCDYYWDGTRRNENILIWQYTLSGYGALRLDGKEYPIRPGEAMIVKIPSVSSYYFPAESSHWDFVFVTLQGREALRLADEFHRLYAPVCPFRPEGKLLRLVQDFFTLPPGRMLDPFFNSAAAYHFAMEMFSEVRNVEENPDEKLLKKLRNHILVHMSENPSLEELADLAGCTPWHFSRKFHKISGTSPHQFVLELKMQYAAQLLQNSLDPIKEIAARCGYEDPSYFCKVFRKYHGISPGEFRN